MGKNLVQTIKEFDSKIYKIEGPLGKSLMLTSGEGEIQIGQVLSYNETTGKLVKYVSGTNEAFSIAMTEADATSEDVPVLVAVPNTRFNSKEVIGMTLATDFKGIKELWSNGITLEEVR